MIRRTVILAVLLVAAGCSSPSIAPEPSPLVRFPAEMQSPLEAPCLAGRRAGRLLQRFGEALVAGDLAGAGRILPDLERVGSSTVPVRLGGAELALLQGDPQLALQRLRAGDEQPAGCWGLVTVETRALLAVGDPEGAWRAAGRLESTAPGSLELRRRAEDARIDTTLGRVREFLAAEDLAAAGDEAGRLVEDHPGRLEGYLAKAEVERRSARPGDAMGTLEGAADRFPEDDDLLRLRITVAGEAGDWDAALELARQLVGRDPNAAAVLAEVERQWSLAHAPPEVRQAQSSRELTRGQLAVLLWWQVPEVRSLPVDQVPIATDVVGRVDRSHVVRALALGLWRVDPVTHRAEPDHRVRRSEMGHWLGRLASRVGGRLPVELEEELTGSQVLDGDSAARILAAFRRGIFSAPR